MTANRDTQTGAQTGAERILDLLLSADGPLRAYVIAERLGMVGFHAHMFCHELASEGMAMEVPGMYGGWVYT